MFAEILYALYFFLFGSAQSANNTATEPFTPLNCIPNRMFIYDHNICYCDDKGQNITCKRKLYSTLYPELRAYHLQNLTMDCSAEIPGKKVIDVGCHECICKDSKHATCIPSSCNIKQSVFNTLERCVPGSILIDKCNGCICGPDGMATCTNLDCYALHGIKKSDDVLCVPNKDLFVECNECSCSKSGMSISCQKVGCDYPNFIHRHLLNVTTLCNPKNVFDYGPCHKCMCSRTGIYAMCTGVQCNDQYDIEDEGESNIFTNSIDRCNPGMIFANDCNVCICNKFGKGVCTTLSCDINYSFKYVKQLTYSIPKA